MHPPKVGGEGLWVGAGFSWCLLGRRGRKREDCNFYWCSLLPPGGGIEESARIESET